MLLLYITAAKMFRQLWVDKIILQGSVFFVHRMFSPTFTLVLSMPSDRWSLLEGWDAISNNISNHLKCLELQNESLLLSKRVVAAMIVFLKILSHVSMNY